MVSAANIPRGEMARQAWARLPRSERMGVIREAERGRAVDDPRLAVAAVGWAWEVLGSPGCRRTVSRWIIAFDFLTGLALGVGNVARRDFYDGSQFHDLNPFVRSTARAVEKANPLAD